MSSKEIICEDCLPPSSSNPSTDEPQTQPASVNTMAHESSQTGKKVNISSKDFRFPVPVEPPSIATHKTEFTITGPPTPHNELNVEKTLDGVGGGGAEDKQGSTEEMGKKKEKEKEKGFRSPEIKKDQLSLQQQQQQQLPSQDHHQHKAEHEQASKPSEAVESFQSPNLNDIKPSVIIEFCDRCRWAPRATWIQTELFLTFPNPLIRSITLLPLNAPETGGRFRVWVDVGKGDELVWDRKTEGGFPELKILKQRIRNLVQPDLNLGHSDVGGKQQ